VHVVEQHWALAAQLPASGKPRNAASRPTSQVCAGAARTTSVRTLLQSAMPQTGDQCPKQATNGAAAAWGAAGLHQSTHTLWQGHIKARTLQQSAHSCKAPCAPWHCQPPNTCQAPPKSSQSDQPCALLTPPSSFPWSPPLHFRTWGFTAALGGTGSPCRSSASCCARRFSWVTGSIQ